MWFSTKKGWMERFNEGKTSIYICGSNLKSRGGSIFQSFSYIVSVPLSTGNIKSGSIGVIRERGWGVWGVWEDGEIGERFGNSRHGRVGIVE